MSTGRTATGDGFNLFIKLCVYTSEEDTDKARYYTEKSPFSKKTIYLPPECTSVQHAVQVEPGHFFICYGKPSTVCQVSNGGSFESTSWKPAQLEESPGHLSVSNDGNVYLTNRKQVILLSQKTLEEIPVSEELRSIKNPTRITCLPRRRAIHKGTRTCAYLYDPESDDEE